MLTHGEIWDTIDRLAAQHGLSTSGLARQAGLDPTTFNRSKRMTPEGKLRWPSTESLAKILAATGTSMSDFMRLLSDDPPDPSELGAGAAEPQPRTIPVIGYAEAGQEGYFDDAGYPAGQGWDALDFPHVEDSHAYALEISGASMEPAYRDGDIIIVSPGSSVRRGDRVVLRTHEGEVMAKQLARQTAKRIELRSLNPDYPNSVLAPAEVDWIARILWASQ